MRSLFAVKSRREFGVHTCCQAIANQRLTNTSFTAQLQRRSTVLPSWQGWRKEPALPSRVRQSNAETAETLLVLFVEQLRWLFSEDALSDLRRHAMPTGRRVDAIGPSEERRRSLLLRNAFWDARSFFPQLSFILLPVLNSGADRYYNNFRSAKSAADPKQNRLRSEVAGVQYVRSFEKSGACQRYVILINSGIEAQLTMIRVPLATAQFGPPGYGGGNPYSNGGDGGPPEGFGGPFGPAFSVGNIGALTVIVKVSRRLVLIAGVVPCSRGTRSNGCICFRPTVSVRLHTDTARDLSRSLAGPWYIPDPGLPSVHRRSRGGHLLGQPLTHAITSPSSNWSDLSCSTLLPAVPRPRTPPFFHEI